MCRMTDCIDLHVVSSSLYIFPIHTKAIHQKNQSYNNPFLSLHTNEYNFIFIMYQRVDVSIISVLYISICFLFINYNRQFIISILIQFFQKQIHQFCRWKFAFEHITTIAANFIVIYEIFLLCIDKREIRLMRNTFCNNSNKSMYSVA